MKKVEALDDVERDIRKNYARFYWSEDSTTIMLEDPKVPYIEPAKLLKRFKKAKRYVWMVTIDGSSQGVYENAASSCLFSTERDALDFVRGQLSDIVADNILGCMCLSFDILGAAIEKHCKWFGEHEAQFRDGDSVTDFKIEKVVVPEYRRERRKK